MPPIGVSESRVGPGLALRRADAASSSIVERWTAKLHAATAAATRKAAGSPKVPATNPAAAGAPTAATKTIDSTKAKSRERSRGESSWAARRSARLAKESARSAQTLARSDATEWPTRSQNDVGARAHATPSATKPTMTRQSPRFRPMQSLEPQSQQHAQRLQTQALATTRAVTRDALATLWPSNSRTRRGSCACVMTIGTMPRKRRSPAIRIGRRGTRTQTMATTPKGSPLIGWV